MMMNGKQYIESLKKLRPNIYKWGKLIEDVTTNQQLAAKLFIVGILSRTAWRHN